MDMQEHSRRLRLSCLGLAPRLQLGELWRRGGDQFDQLKSADWRAEGKVFLVEQGR